MYHDQKTLWYMWYGHPSHRNPYDGSDGSINPSELVTPKKKAKVILLTMAPWHHGTMAHIYIYIYIYSLLWRCEQLRQLTFWGHKPVMFPGKPNVWRKPEPHKGKMNSISFPLSVSLGSKLNEHEHAKTVRVQHQSIKSGGFMGPYSQLIQ